LVQRSNKIRQNTPKLVSLYISPTEFCNLKCKHCWTSPRFSRSDKQSLEDTDIKIFKKGILEAKKLGLSHVKFTGSEPLMYKNAIELFKFVRSKGLSFSVETNGTLIDDFTAKMLAKYKVAYISVSLDSTNSIGHDKFRGVNGSFDASVQGLENLKKYKIPSEIIFSLVRSSVDDLFNMPFFAKSLGVNCLKINIVEAIARAENLNDKGELLSVAENIKIFRKFEQKFIKIPRYDLSIMYDLPIAFKSTAALRQTTNLSRCGIHNILGILPNGKLAICGIGFIKKDAVLGDLNHESLTDVWINNNFLKQIREDIPKNFIGICSECIFKNFCLGKCIANNLYRGNRHNQSFEFCEEANRLGLFPRSRKISNRPKSKSKSEL
jgi:SynChlorMet cassette radical SAM/SPASM protein ScmF